jgi:hypothetical protein
LNSARGVGPWALRAAWVMELFIASRVCAEHVNNANRPKMSNLPQW